MTQSEIIIEVPLTILRKSGLDLTEGRWQTDNKTGLAYRINPARPEMRIDRRNVHIAHPNQTAARNKQVSWNDDTTRHDAGSFDAEFNGLPSARELAARVLKLPPGTKLEDVSAAEAIVDRLLESVESPLQEQVRPFKFRVVESR